MKRIRENSIFKILVVFLVFLVVNFDQTAGIVFSLMIIADIFIWFDDKIFTNKVSYPFERTVDNRFQSILETLVFLAGFIFLQSLILRFLSPSIQSQTQSIQQLLSLYSTTTPALAGNKLVTLLLYGIIVPIVETRFFFGRVFEMVIDRFNIRGGLKNTETWIVSVFIGAIFAVYHLTARRCGAAGTCENTALLITFVFGTLSTLMVAKYRETKQATLLHIIWNVIASLYALGLLSGIMGLI